MHSGVVLAPRGLPEEADVVWGFENRRRCELSTNMNPPYQGEKAARTEYRQRQPVPY